MDGNSKFSSSSPLSDHLHSGFMYISSEDTFLIKNHKNILTQISIFSSKWISINERFRKNSENVLLPSTFSMGKMLGIVENGMEWHGTKWKLRSSSSSYSLLLLFLLCNCSFWVFRRGILVSWLFVYFTDRTLGSNRINARLEGINKTFVNTIDRYKFFI